MDKIRNENIRKSMNARGIIEKIKIQQLRWFEHVNRMEVDQNN